MGRRERRRNRPDDYPLTLAEAKLPAAPSDVIRILGPLLTERRWERIEAVLTKRTRSVIPVLEGVIDPHNISAVLRSADAFGLQEVHGVEGDMPFRASRRIARGTDRWVDLKVHRTTNACMSELSARGYRIFVGATDGEASLSDLRQIEKVALVFGNEHLGVSNIAERGAHGTFSVPMSGFVESLNVSVAAAVSLFTVRGDRPGDLSMEDREQLEARFLMLSVRDAFRVVEEQLHASGEAHPPPD